MKKKNKSPIEVTDGSDNVFADLGFRNPELELLKADMVRRIHSIIRERKLTQVQAAKILRLAQPKVSALLNGGFDSYSLERLFRLLRALGQDVDVTMKTMPVRAKRHPRLRAIAA